MSQILHLIQFLRCLVGNIVGLSQPDQIFPESIKNRFFVQLEESKENGAGIERYLQKIILLTLSVYFLI